MDPLVVKVKLDLPEETDQMDLQVQKVLPEMMQFSISIK